MQNRKNIFEEEGGFNLERPNKKEFPKQNNFEKKDLGHEKVEEELSFLFKEKRKELSFDNDKAKPIGGNIVVFEKKVEELLILAFAKSPEEAINKAITYNDPYLLDEFHDRLIEEMRKKNLN